MKPVRLLRYMFLFAFLGPECARPSIAYLSFWSLLTTRNIALIYSVTICEQKTEDCARWGRILTQTIASLFSTLMFAGFHNQSPLLTMVKFSTQRETINLQLIQRRSQSPKYKFCKGKLTDCLLGSFRYRVGSGFTKQW